MKIVLQRVNRASVHVGEDLVASIGRGLLLLVGVGREDTAGHAAALAKKISGLRIFEDPPGKMNLSLREVGGEILAVPQFTLWGNAQRGRRPDFSAAAPADQAWELFQRFCREVRNLKIPLATGAFREHMRVLLENDGPVTLILDSNELTLGS
ncbi:MAG: D-tyrosyl-tRNA(Tyr) deacylase [Candidatus Firestonebacteria bacterium]|nr:D-tyrosyl-tRNA(Tyr) deacylase [Candidatus Firestonebacteria bacterium]